MRVDFTYLKLNKIARFLMMVVFCFMVLTIILFPFAKHDDFKINYNCIRIIKNDRYCTFNCSFTSEEDSIGRIIVSHTTFAAIYDKELNFTRYKTEYLNITIPNRDYLWLIRGGFFNEKHLGTLEGSLRC